MVGPNDLRGLFQPQQLCDAVILKQLLVVWSVACRDQICRASGFCQPKESLVLTGDQDDGHLL